MTVRTRVKICGITRLEDAQTACRAGADAIGFVFFRPSPRYIEPTRAADIVAELPPFLAIVAVVVDPDAGEIESLCDTVPLDLIQFHGQETPEFCDRSPRPYMKAIRMNEGVDPQAEAARYVNARALLLDSYAAEINGGTGLAFDWKRAGGSFPRPVVLAGGLSPENVAEAIRAVRPFAVDVSSGVERDKGIKDPERIKQFLESATDVNKS